MRARLAFGTATAAIAFVIASCRFPSPGASCDDDPSRCPESSRAANSVTCDCECTVGLSESTGDTFKGKVAVCLPAELNAEVATPDEQASLDALEPKAFNQRVYQYCSRTVADFMRTAIRLQAREVIACAVPLSCTCNTQGATTSSSTCRTGCKEVACDTANCRAVLRKSGHDALVTMGACFCSRASACGSTSPSHDTPGICRDLFGVPSLGTVTITP
jgi:hypothetical protein